MFVVTHWKAVYLWYELMLTNCFYSQKQVGKGSNCAGVLKALRTRRKPANPNHINSYLMIKFSIIIRIKRQTARTTDIIVLTLKMPLLLCTTKTGWRPSLMNHQLKGIWPPSSPDYNPIDYFMWSEFESEVSKQPHNILASLKAKISEVMTNMDR